MHGICGGEFQAMEAAGRTLYDFPDAPWEFQLDMARQVWDESRHAEIYIKLLEYVGSYYGEFPERRSALVMHAGRGSGVPASPASIAASKGSPATSSSRLIQASRRRWAIR
jgi:hypothetical protein